MLGDRRGHRYGPNGLPEEWCRIEGYVPTPYAKDRLIRPLRLKK